MNPSPDLCNRAEKYPEIEVEFSIDYGSTDIIKDSFDAGVRLGDAVSKDMIAMRIGPDFRFLVAGAPSYFDRYPRPDEPHDLTKLPCINLRSMTAGSFFPWTFEKDGKEINVRVEGQLAFNSVLAILNSAVEGAGLAYLPEDLVAPHLRSGALVAVMEDWCPYGPGYHLHYSSRRLAARSFSAFRETMRYGVTSS